MKRNHPQKQHLCGVCVNQKEYKKLAQKYVNYILSMKQEGDLVFASGKPIFSLFNQI